MRVRHSAPRWGSRSGSALGPGLFGFLAFLVLGGGIAFFGIDRRYAEVVEQPIAFNHRKHVEDEAMACSDCHNSYSTETFSGFPSTQFCSLCHLDPQGESSEERKLVDMLQQAKRLEWKSVFRQPSHVFFSHRRHVVVAEIECETCHGSIGMSEAPPSRRNPLSMDECMECHERMGESTDCTACHR